MAHLRSGVLRRVRDWVVWGTPGWVNERAFHRLYALNY